MCSKTVFVVGCLFLFSVSAEEFLKNIKLCSPSDKELSSCVKENIQHIIKLGKNGFTDRGTVALDPLFIDFAQTPDSSGAVTLKQKFINFTFSGISDMKIMDIKTNFDKKCQIKMKNFQPKAVIQGDYEADGRLLLFQVKGADKFEVILNKINAGTIINCEFYQKDNEKYFRILNIKFQLRPESGHFSFPNIVQNNAELSRTINQIINENFIDIFNEFKETIQNKLELLYGEIVNKLLDGIPANKLFKF